MTIQEEELLDLVKYAASAQCGCTFTSCIHDKIRTVIERYYTSNFQVQQLRDRIRGFEEAQAEAEKRLDRMYSGG